MAQVTQVLKYLISFSILIFIGCSERAVSPLDKSTAATPSVIEERWVHRDTGPEVTKTSRAATAADLPTLEPRVDALTAEGAPVSRKTAFVLINFSDTTPPKSGDAMRALAASVADYIRTVSYGKSALSSVIDHARQGDVFGWITVPLSVNGVCIEANVTPIHVGRMAEDQIAAQHFSGDWLRYYHAYDTVLYLFGAIPRCNGQAVLSSTGGRNSTRGADGIERFRRGDAYIIHLDLQTVLHELGHTYGLGHSGLWGADGTLRTYGDPFCPMGNRGSAVWGYNAGHLGYLHFGPPGTPLTETAGWLQAETVTASGSYTLRPLTEPEGLRALRIGLSDGYQYVLEYRTQSGTVDGEFLVPGIYMRRVRMSTTWLMDPTPATSTTDAALLPGAVYSDTANGVYIRAGSGGAVDVSLGTPLPPVAQPAPTPTPEPTPAPRPSRGRGKRSR